MCPLYQSADPFARGKEKRMTDIQTNLVNDVLIGMGDLDAETAERLKTVLYHHLHEYTIEKQETLPAVELNKTEQSIRYYIMCKKLKNCSQGTLEGYLRNLQIFFTWANKDYDQISTTDIRMYLAWYKETRKVSNVYLDSLRLNLSSYFTWLHNEGYITSNPAKGVEPINYEKKMKEPYSGEEMECLRFHCESAQERCVVEVLYSTGMRVGELVGVNKADIDWTQGRIVIFGKKGKKDRPVYLTPQAIYHVKRYLAERTDDNPALIVTSRRPHNRMTDSGIQSLLRTLGIRTGVKKVHPHRFRRTLASDAFRREVPAEQVKEILGHVKIETTLLYGKVAEESVQSSFRKAIA